MLLTDIIINCAEPDCPFFAVCNVAQTEGTHSPVIVSRYDPADKSTTEECMSFDTGLIVSDDDR